jgi:hypothetical protein
MRLCSRGDVDLLVGSTRLAKTNCRQAGKAALLRTYAADLE